jgi:thiol-disulfide isomerase/thioredoxin
VARGPHRIGISAPGFTVQDAERKITLSQFRGQVVVLNFWATWCPPCVQETPSLIQMQQRLKEKGVVVVAVSIDVDDGTYHRFLKDYRVDMLTVRDPDQKKPGAVRNPRLARDLHHRPHRPTPPEIRRAGRLEQPRGHRVPD